MDRAAQADYDGCVSTRAQPQRRVLLCADEVPETTGNKKNKRKSFFEVNIELRFYYTLAHGTNLEYKRRV